MRLARTAARAQSCFISPLLFYTQTYFHPSHTYVVGKLSGAGVGLVLGGGSGSIILLEAIEVEEHKTYLHDNKNIR